MSAHHNKSTDKSNQIDEKTQAAWMVEYKRYERHLLRYGHGLMFDDQLPGEFVRSHYFDREHGGFYVYCRPDGTVIELKQLGLQ